MYRRSGWLVGSVELHLHSYQILLRLQPCDGTYLALSRFFLSFHKAPYLSRFLSVGKLLRWNGSYCSGLGRPQRSMNIASDELMLVTLAIRQYY